nr:hypothetical protein [Actinomycetota bacterium]
MRVPKRFFKRATLFATPLSALLILGLVQSTAAPAQTPPPPKQKDMGLAALVKALTTPPPP